MNNINKDYIIDYINELIPNKDENIKIIEAYGQRHNIPIIEPEVAQFIKTLLKIHKPKNILEIGTAIGYSSLIMADALNGDCKITSIERREDMLELAKKNIYTSPYKDNINLILGEAEEVIPNIDEKFDFIFIDAAKGQYLKFFNICIDYLDSNGVILSDNVLFKGMVATNKLVVRRNKTIVKRLREFLEYINTIDGYTTSVIPIGDGVALTYKEV
ncbi:MAG TPA: O-methyltransferase [Tissierellaceae bacterium]|nr:O-methyltransferase [Tissierellaceae bacterium]